MSSYAVTGAETFTITHARDLASRIATDLKRIQRLYDEGPSDEQIAEYEQEAIELVRRGFLSRVTYGFKKDGCWIEPSVHYKANEIYSGTSDDSPGGIVPGKNVTGAHFTSFLVYNDAWDQLSAEERQAVKAEIALKRTTGTEPKVAAGSYLTQDKTYSAGGRALVRSTVRS